MTQHNGNKNGAHHRITDLEKTGGPSAAELMEPPAWLKSMREAISGAIQSDDLKEIMAAQVRKARAGDERAAKFVLDQANKLIESETRRQVSITQNNYYDVEQRPDTPAKVLPGDPRKISKMCSRAAAGLPLTDPADGPRVSDEEEKQLRRQQEAIDQDSNP